MSPAVLWAQLAVACAAAGLFALVRRERGLGPLWAGLAALGLFAYVGFGRLHGEGRFLHVWDTYHYYIGAKYYDELGYERLYECTAVADAEAGLRRETALRTMTELRSNQQTTTLQILAHPERCTARFSAARWAAFAEDVAFFRERAGRATWQAMQRDHGYNATPAWQLVGGALARLVPASERGLGALALVDPLLLLAAVGLLVWAFGWRVAALFAVFVGTYFPARFYWTGGALLRLDWLVLAVAGVCCLRKDRFVLGGAALALSAMFRLFPAAFLVGPVVAALGYAWRAGRISPSHGRVLLGAALATALVAPASLWAAGDVGRGFARNTAKHAATPLTNHMGLPALAGFRPEATVRALRQERGLAPKELWPAYRAARLEASRRAAWLVWLGRALALAALVLASRQAPWRAAALGVVLVPVWVSLTCYYYVFVALAAVLAESRRAVAGVLLGLAAASLALPLCAVRWQVGMDELYAAQSALALLALAALAGLSLGGWRAGLRARVTRRTA